MGCLDEDTVLAFIDGTLDASDRRSAESHLASCADCSDVVGTAAGGLPAALSDLGDAPSQAPSGFVRGAAVGRYVILNLVGRGGMGEVYAAYDPQLDRKVALKLLREQAPQAGRTSHARLLREAKAAARLSHPNVVVVHDAGAIDDPTRGELVFLAMEFIDGQTLSAWLAGAQRSWREVRDVLVAAGEGLAAAHDAGLVHRDFKPQNVMVGRDGSVRVADFGLASDGAALSERDPALLSPEILAAAPTSHTMTMTKTGALLGTPLYMAPEQFLARPTDARSDQFSFCVSLYEALYGERPFPSDTLSAIVDAVVSGRVREPPTKARVPAFLRRILLRGLRPDPAERWPSMRALLEELRRDPTRQRRRIALAATGAAILVAAIAGSQHWSNRGQRLCRAAGSKLDGIWETIPDGARRGAVHAAFMATGKSFAEETWAHVSAVLDDYNRRWTSIYTDACEATNVRGDQSAEVLDLRMSCLDQTRGALRALTDVLSHADAGVLLQAVNAANALPVIDRCSDVALLRQAVPPPTDLATRTSVSKVRDGLADVKALRDTGQVPEALRRIAPLVKSAEQTGYAAVIAEVLGLRGLLEDTSGDVTRARATFEQALWQALAARQDDAAVQCATALAVISGYYFADYHESHRWTQLAEALLPRLGPGHEATAGWVFHNRGAVRARQGDLAGAVDDFRLALKLKEKVLPPQHPDLGITIEAAGQVELERRDYPAALAAQERALGIFKKAYGERSPLLARSIGNRGELLALVGRPQEAERDLRDAIERWITQVGPDHVWVAYPLTALGKTLLDEGRSDEARSTLERALRIRERDEKNAELVAETRFALARALRAEGREPERARGLATSAREAYRSVPAQEKQVAEIDAWLGANAGGARAAGPRR